MTVDEGEDRTVPGARDGIAFDLSLVERAGEVWTGGGNRPDGPVTPHEHHLDAFGGNGDRFIVGQFGFVHDLDPIAWRVLERGVIDADAEVVGEVAAKLPAGGDQTKTGQRKCHPRRAR